MQDYLLVYRVICFRLVEVRWAVRVKNSSAVRGIGLGKRHRKLAACSRLWVSPAAACLFFQLSPTLKTKSLVTLSSHEVNPEGSIEYISYTMVLVICLSNRNQEVTCFRGVRLRDDTAALE